MSLHFNEYEKRLPGELIFYGNASHGLYDMLVWLQQKRPKENPNIVMPIYIPAKLYRTVLAAGYNVRFYDVTPGLQFNIDGVKELIGEQTQAVFCVHYFGIPSPVQELKAEIRNKEAFLIEDCAHTFASQWEGTELGSVGDCAIFSGRKMLQLPAGGFLALNRKPWEFTPTYNKRVRSIFTACKLTRLRLKSLYYKLTQGYDPLNLAWIPSTGYIKFSEKHRITTQQISRLNKIYTYAIDLEKVVNKRRENYEFVYNGIKNVSTIQPVTEYRKEGGILSNQGEEYQLREGITPYSLPVLVPPGKRKNIRQLLCDNGVGCGAGWPESPFGIEGFPQAEDFSERLLELPVHHGMSKYQLERMVESLKMYDAHAPEGQVGAPSNESKQKLEVA